MNHAQPSSEMIPDSISVVTDTDPLQGRGTILLVEDESFLLEVTCEILESAGYRVLKARNAAEAVSAFRQFHCIVRLLLTDVVLPGQNGRDLPHELRSISPDLRIIFICDCWKLAKQSEKNRLKSSARLGFGFPLVCHGRGICRQSV